MLRELRKQPSRYHIFVLSLWEEGGVFPGEEARWRFSLEQAQAARRMGFKDLAELTAYLEAWTRMPPGDEPAGRSQRADAELS
jgi:hypothetical protein